MVNQMAGYSGRRLKQRICFTDPAERGGVEVAARRAAVARHLLHRPRRAGWGRRPQNAFASDATRFAANSSACSLFEAADGADRIAITHPAECRSEPAGVAFRQPTTADVLRLDRSSGARRSARRGPGRLAADPRTVKSQPRRLGRHRRSVWPHVPPRGGRCVEPRRARRRSRKVLVSGRDGKQVGLWLTRGIASAAADHSRRGIARSALRAGSTFRRPAMLVTTTLRCRIRSLLGLGRRPAM